MKNILTKLTLLILIVAFALSFSACKKDASTATGDADNVSSASSEMASQETGVSSESSDDASSEKPSSSPAPESSSSSKPAASSKPAVSSKPTESQPSTTNKPTIVGTWSGILDMTEAIRTSIGAENPSLGNLDFDFKIGAVYTFKNDGKYTMSLNKNDYKTSFTNLMRLSVRSSLEDSLEGTGMTVDEYLAQTGTTIDGLIEQFIDIDAFIDGVEFDMVAKYKISDNKLYMTESENEEFIDGEYTIYELSETTLKFTDVVGIEEEELGYVLPLILTKS